MRMNLISLFAVTVLSVPAMAQIPETGEQKLPWRIYGSWVEFDAKEGPIAKALGPLLLVAQEKPDVSALITSKAGVDADPSSNFCCADPFRLENTDGNPANNGLCTGILFEFCQLAECALGNVLGLPPDYSEFLAVTDGSLPECVDCWNGTCNDRLRIQFNAGGSVFFGTVVGSNSHLNLNPYVGAGASVWLGCTTESGLEIRAGFSSIVGQQFTESRR